MGKRRTKKELQTFDEFEESLREEISVSSEFGLPLTVLTLNIEGGWKEEDVRRTLGSIRTADLITQPEASEILVALPNTATSDARVVEEKLRKIVPNAAFGVAVYERGDSVENLVKCSRSSARRDQEKHETS